MPHNDTDRFHCHHSYLERATIWTQTADLLAGDHTCLTKPKYLWLHSLEDPARFCDEGDKENAKRDRNRREEQTRYVNYLGMAEERFVSLLMKGGISTDDIEDLFGDDIDNVDGNGNDIEEFMTMVAREIVSYGVAYVFTDSGTVEARSRAEELDLGARPYWQLIKALDFKDWQLDSNGRYEKFRYEYMVVMPRESMEDEPILAHYTTIAQVIADDEGSLSYELQVWESIDEDGHLVNHHPSCANEQTHHSWRIKGEPIIINELGSIPLATNRIQKSCLENVIDQALKIYNKQSCLDNILYADGYDRVFVSAETAIQFGADGEPLSQEAKEARLSAGSFLLLPPNSDVIKLEPTNPEATVESIRADILDFFRIAFNQARQVRQDSGAVEDANTRREVKEDLLTRMERLRNKLLGVMNKAIKDYAMFKNRDADFDGEITFKERLSELDLEQLFSFGMRFADRMLHYPTARKEYDKKVFSLINLGSEEDILEEIDTTELPSPEEQQAQAGVTGPGLRGAVRRNGRQNRSVSQRNSGNRQENR